MCLVDLRSRQSAVTSVDCKEVFLQIDVSYLCVASLIPSGAAFVGWLVGKVSYRRQCEEKLMKLPNSTIGEALRRKRGITSPDV